MFGMARKRRHLLDRLVGGTIFAEPDTESCVMTCMTRSPIKRAKADRSARIVCEYEERARIRDHAAM
jgi:hypothetical protein